MMDREKVRELIIKTCVEVIVGDDPRARAKALELLRKIIDADLYDKVARSWKHDAQGSWT